MRAARIHSFGGPEVIVVEDVPRPTPEAGEILVRVEASGVGPWDALIREGKSKVSPKPPLTLGSDLSGIVEEIGPGVKSFRKGDEVYGVTNSHFCGANAGHAIAYAGMVALKPKRLSHFESASVPVVAVTAWQMLNEYGKGEPGQTVMILGAAGNVGAYAVQLAARTGMRVISVVSADDMDYVSGLGSERVLNYKTERFENAAQTADLVLDLVGGETAHRAAEVVKPGGTVVSVVASDPPTRRSDVRSAFFYAEVTTARLDTMTALLDRHEISLLVGTVLPLEDIRSAHKMLGGASHVRGKIVLGRA